MTVEQQSETASHRDTLDHEEHRQPPAQIIMMEDQNVCMHKYITYVTEYEKIDHLQ